MRAPIKARVLLTATVAAGTAVIVAASAAAVSSDLSLATLALFAAAVVATELFQVPESGDVVGDEQQAFSFSSGIHVATVLVLGPWAGALVAAFGIIVVDSFRGFGARRVAFNASVFALAAAVGGWTFVALGGAVGAPDLPADMLPIGALAATAYLVNATLVGSIVAFSSGVPLAPLVSKKIRVELSPAAAEAGLGVAFAFLAVTEPWAAVALVPLVVAVYQGHARLAALGSETAAALETFANVVDERDGYTYRHSARVAELVRDLADALGLPSSDVSRLRWAGRLHDLGKIAVDAEVLRKPTALDPSERDAMRRHARLSARMLRRFRFAAQEARAVEFHHERYDGRGYYGIQRGEIPLAAHFLSVADAFDAMTSYRPYRPALPAERALQAIEEASGTQFHPTVARAFVALQRGLAPLDVLSKAERAELRRLTTVTPSRARRRLLSALRGDVAALAAVVAALAGAGTGHTAVTAASLVGVAASLAWIASDRIRAARLAAGLRAAVSGPRTHRLAFRSVVDQLASLATLRWVGFVAWRPVDLTGTVELEWNGGDAAPTETSLTSWLLRETETRSGVLRAEGADLGTKGTHVALPLRAGSPEPIGFLVLGFARSVPHHVARALEDAAADVGAAFADATGLPDTAPLAAAS